MYYTSFPAQNYSLAGDAIAFGGHIPHITENLVFSNFSPFFVFYEGSHNDVINSYVHKWYIITLQVSILKKLVS